MSQMDVMFLGTASQAPSLTRNVSALAVRFLKTGSLWLFDCGEATQHQIQKCPLMKLSKVEVICITHLHGDHVFGLPGLLCSISATTSPAEDKVVTLIGPVGLGDYVLHTMAASRSFIAYKLRVIELEQTGAVDKDGEPVPPEPEPSTPSRQFALEFSVKRLKSADTFPSIFSDANASIAAAAIEHTVPTVGFVVQEPEVKGSLQMKFIKPMLDANAEALAAAGVKKPMALMGKLKKSGRVELPDGSVLDVTDERVCTPNRPGRCTVILGDTCASPGIEKLVSSCDLLIHEATNAKTDEDKEEYEEIEAKAIDHGHSTPQMAGAFAKRIGAKYLALTHFSARYKGDSSPESLAVMDGIAAQAATAMDADVSRVVCARDLLQINLTATNVLSVVPPGGGGGDVESKAAPSAGAGSGTGAAK